MRVFPANVSLYPAGNVAHVQGGFYGPISTGCVTSAPAMPDRAAATAAYPLCYEELIVDAKGRVSDLGTCCYNTGATISLNTYVPSSTKQFAVSGYTSGATVPASCVMAALRLNTTNKHPYSCGTDGMFHDLTGFGEGNGSSLNFRGAWAASTAYPSAMSRSRRAVPMWNTAFKQLRASTVELDSAGGGRLKWRCRCGRRDGCN